MVQRLLRGFTPTKKNLCVTALHYGTKTRKTGINGNHAQKVSNEYPWIGFFIRITVLISFWVHPCPCAFKRGKLHVFDQNFPDVFWFFFQTYWNLDRKLCISVTQITWRNQISYWYPATVFFSARDHIWLLWKCIFTFKEIDRNHDTICIGNVRSSSTRLLYLFLQKIAGFERKTLKK